MDIAEVTNKHISDYIKRESEIFEQYIRVLAEPPIKGEITASKLKWRGIRICQQMGTNERWVEQRGKQISPKVSFTFSYK